MKRRKAVAELRAEQEEETFQATYNDSDDNLKRCLNIASGKRIICMAELPSNSKHGLLSKQSGVYGRYSTSIQLQDKRCSVPLLLRCAELD